MATGAELKRIRATNNLSAQQLAALVGIDLDRLKKWEQRDQNPRAQDAEKLLSFFGVQALADLTQVSKVPSSENTLVTANFNGEGVPAYDVEFAGGDRQSSFFWEGEHPIAYFNIPEVLGCEAIIRARGESMARRINPRDWVGIREVKDFRDFLPYGHIYGVETKEFGLFKYVRKSKKADCVLLTSENEAYEPQDLALDKIIRLWQVRVVIPISQILLLA